jgi:hypothetical protein
MSIGDTFQTGKICPVSGVYHNMTHSHTPGQDKIPLSKGETFPPCRGCPVAVTWKLVEIT